MHAYSMDLPEQALLDSDAGMKAADVAAKYRAVQGAGGQQRLRRRPVGTVLNKEADVRSRNLMVTPQD
jgi:hypothetical protein